MRKILFALSILWIALAFAPAHADQRDLAMLTVNELNGFNAAGEAAGGATPTLSFIGCTVDTGNNTTYTYTNHAIGTAGTRTVIVVALGEDQGATDFSASSMTIGGNAAAEQADTAAVTANQTAIYSLAVAAGTTATIAVTWSEAITISTVCVWAAYDLSSATATDFAVSTGASPLTLDTDVQTDGVAVGGCNMNSNAGSYTWAGLAEQADSNANGEYSYGAADYDGAAATPLGITCTADGAQANNAGAVAAFR